MYPMNNQISLCIRSVWSDSSLSAWRNFAFLAAVHRLIWIFTGHMFEATFSDVLFPVLCCAVPFVLFLSKVNKVLLENKIFKKKIQNKNLTTYLCLLAKSPFCVFFFLVIRRLQLWAHLGVATFFHGDWSWNIFYSHSLPSSDSRKAVVSFWWKNVHKYWLTA